MSWFKVDDTAHTHPKLRKAGAAAAGVWMWGGSYAAQYLTDGIIHAHFVRTTATAPQVAKLVKVGLWHPAGHDCPRCPQPADGDYLMHDYLIYNPTRQKVMAERDRAAEKKRKQRAGASADDSPGGSRSGFEKDSASNRDGIEDDSRPNGTYNSEPVSETFPGQSDLSRGDSLGTRARAVTRPDPSVPPLEEQTEETASYARDVPRIGDRPRIPPNCQPLVEALEVAGMVVGWDIHPNEWFLIEALIKRCGIHRMVISARGSWQGAIKQPRKGTYFLPAWRDLSDAPAARPEPEQEYLPAAVGDNVHRLPDPSHRPSTTDARVNQAVETGRRLQALADAQRLQEQS